MIAVLLAVITLTLGDAGEYGSPRWIAATQEACREAGIPVPTATQLLAGVRVTERARRAGH